MGIGVFSTFRFVKTNKLGTCESEIFVRIVNRIGGYDSNLESNQGVVVHVFIHSFIML